MRECYAHGDPCCTQCPLYADTICTGGRAACRALGALVRGPSTVVPSDHYYTLVIPWEPEPAKRTAWHPTEQTGDFSILTRGYFLTVPEAHAWARVNIPGGNYQVRLEVVREDQPIGWLTSRSGHEGGFLVLGICCAGASLFTRIAKLYPINVRPYKQSCRVCKTILIAGSSRRDLFDGT